MIDILKEFLSYLKDAKKLWMLPLLLLLISFGVLIVITQGSSLSPFIYTVF